ncbi:tRNA (guanosine(37)-N1)-methyltransferase TrmD [Patescibacteria group bacterium]
MINFHIITIFPDMFSSYVNESILARAQKDKKIKIKFYDPRDFTKDKHKRVDDKPYGGGPGMVMAVDPIVRAAQKAIGQKKGVKVFITSPAGKQFTNVIAKNISKKNKDVVIICGRYEGIDARVKKILRAEEISIGPFVVTGGEVPAMVMIDAISRQIPGVLGSAESIEESRIASSETYTRPEIFKHKGKNYKVPKVLLSGDHKKIEEWRKNKG